MSLLSSPWKLAVTASVGMGAAFGVFFRLFAAIPVLQSGASLVMTSAFLVLGSVAVGAITVDRLEASRPRNAALWIVLPWLAITLTDGIVYLINLEGLICVVMALPVGWLFGSVGGVIAGVLSRRRRNRNSLPVLCMAVLPLLLAPLESRLSSPVEYRTVETEIRIHASPAVVWKNIERVPAIAPAELRTTWTHRIGFPRPVEATLSHEGVGGVRHASFERGLLFVETVTQWQPEKQLAFSIKADTARIPPGTLDEHVTIGGRYFDVLRGEYWIEPQAGGDVELHLSSEERLSTDFNPYTELWSDAVMKSLQESILEVIQHRCESQIASAAREAAAP